VRRESIQEANIEITSKQPESSPIPEEVKQDKLWHEVSREMNELKEVATRWFEQLPGLEAQQAGMQKLLRWITAFKKEFSSQSVSKPNRKSHVSGEPLVTVCANGEKLSKQAPLVNDELIVTNERDPEMRLLADRHYSRRAVCANQFLNSGRSLVVRNREGTMLFGWIFPDPEARTDGQVGYNCAIFRNECNRRSSTIIRDCVQLAFERWGPNRCYTYVDPKEILSENPGYCFKCAGWRTVRRADGSIWMSSRGLHLLALNEPPSGLIGDRV